MEQPIPELGAFAETGELFAALGVERSELPVELYHARPGLRLRRARLGGGARRRSRPTSAALAALTAAGVDCFAREERALEGARVRSRPRRPRGPATGSAAGPLAVHLCPPRPDRVRRRRSRSARASRSAGPRRSMRAPRARPERSSASRSAAARSSSRAASSGFPERDRLDLGQLGRERSPEDAAVAREVEPVAARVEQHVGIARRRRRRPARAAGRGPTRARSRPAS